MQYRVLSGTFNELSRQLARTLRKRGIWSERIRTDILAAHGKFRTCPFVPLRGSRPVVGSVQDVDGIPDDIKAVFRTVFELDPHDLIDMVAERAPFIDQSQSFSLFVAQPTPAVLVSYCPRIARRDFTQVSW